MKAKIFNIFKWSCLILNIALSIILIVESCINGENSAHQSNPIGNTLADFFNDISGEQSKVINPTKLSINNKINTTEVGLTYALETKIEPNNSSYTSLIHTSSNEDVAKIDEYGKITFLNKGKTTITSYIKDFPSLKDSFEINVNEVSATSFSIKINNATYDKERNVYILEENKSYKIISSFNPSNTTNKTVSYFLDNNDFVTINENQIKAINKSTSLITLKATHNELISTVNLEVIENTISQNYTSLSDNDLLLGYELMQNNSYSKYINTSSFQFRRFAENYHLRAFAYHKEDAEAFKYSNIKTLNNEELIELKKRQIDLKEIENIDIKFTNTDNFILSSEQIDDHYYITPINPGLITLSVIDNYSNQQINIKINVINYISMQPNPYTLSGQATFVTTNEFNVKTNISLELKMNFNASSTYTKTIFSSSDNNIATIGQDGKIRTIKEGKVKINMLCYDGISSKELINSNGENIKNYYEDSITLNVSRQDLITDLPSFLIQIRKGIGHFGAFFLLGIFSTFTYLLFFEDKKWKFSLSINFSQGILLAILTEIIQLFVPGRGGSIIDILIDVCGFLISSILIALISIINYHKNK